MVMRDSTRHLHLRGVLYGQNVAAVMTTATAVSLLVFSLLYTPCVAAIASIGRELGKKWAVLVVAWQCAVAWIVALIAHLLALAL